MLRLLGLGMEQLVAALFKRAINIVAAQLPPGYNHPENTLEQSATIVRKPTQFPHLTTMPSVREK